MNGLLVIHVASSRLLYGKSYTPRLGLPPEHSGADDADSLPSLDAPVPVPAPAAAAVKPKAMDESLEMMSLAMVITGLYAIAQNVGSPPPNPSPTGTGTGTANGGDQKTNASAAPLTQSSTPDAIASFDTADNIIRFKRYVRRIESIKRRFSVSGRRRTHWLVAVEEGL